MPAMDRREKSSKRVQPAANPDLSIYLAVSLLKPDFSTVTDPLKIPILSNRAKAATTSLGYGRWSRYYPFPMSSAGSPPSSLSVSPTGQTGRISKIVSAFKPGTIITTPRSDVRCIATEWRVADLWLKSVPARVREMLKVAHPDFRDQLESEAKEAGLMS